VTFEPLQYAFGLFQIVSNGYFSGHFPNITGAMFDSANQYRTAILNDAVAALRYAIIIFFLNFITESSSTKIERLQKSRKS